MKTKWENTERGQPKNSTKGPASKSVAHMKLALQFCSTMFLISCVRIAAAAEDDGVGDRVNAILSVQPDPSWAPTLSGLRDARERRELEGQVFIAVKSGEGVKLALVKVSAYPMGYWIAYEVWKKSEIDDFVKGLTPSIEELPTGVVKLQLSNWLEGMKSKSWDALVPSPAQATSDADGKFRMNIPFEGPFVIFARASRETGAGREEYTWVVPLADIKVDEPLLLTNENMTELNY